MTVRDLGPMACVLLACCASTADDSRRFDFEDHGWRERGHFMVGERSFRSGFLPDGKRQLAIGLELSGAPPGSWMELEFGLWGSGNSGSGSSWLDSVFGTPQAGSDELGNPIDAQSTSSLELSLGGRKELSFFEGHLVPYVGGGASALQVRTWELTNGAFSDSVSGDVGLYGHLGFRWVFDSGGSLGFDLRQTGGMDLGLGPGGSRIDGNYTQWAVTASFGL